MTVEKQDKDLEAIATLIYDPALRRDNGDGELISDDRRNELIRQMAMKKFGAEAEEYWTELPAKLVCSESDVITVAFTMYDIHDIAYLKKGRELLGDRLKASVCGYDPGLADVLPEERQYGTQYTFGTTPDEQKLKKYDLVV